MILDGAKSLDELELKTAIEQNKPTPTGPTSQPSSGTQSQ